MNLICIFLFKKNWLIQMFVQIYIKWYIFVNIFMYLFFDVGHSDDTVLTLILKCFPRHCNINKKLWKRRKIIVLCIINHSEKKMRSKISYLRFRKNERCWPIFLNIYILVYVNSSGYIERTHQRRILVINSNCISLKTMCIYPEN